MYGDHETDGDRELIQEKSKETFAGLLPEPAAETQSGVASVMRGSPPGRELMLEYKIAQKRQ